MKRTGAFLAVNALEQVGIRHTFGIPGVHNTEIYDELGKSERITPILVTHELGAAFMADGYSRTALADSYASSVGPEPIGCLMTVPAAGTTHAMSGIGEAYLDGVPMLIISGGTRRDSGRHYQLHQLDQRKLVQAITKKAVVVEDHGEIHRVIYDAYDTAVSGTPGPVFVEIPAEIQLFQREVGDLPEYSPSFRAPKADSAAVADAARRLAAAQHPGIYVGWGARKAWDLLIRLAEMLEAPVATTMQGLGVFPHQHPLHAGFGFGPSAIPAAENAFADCDCLLTVGARFGELATGSYNLPVPAEHIHCDINPEVFGKNYPASLTLTGDARETVAALLADLARQGARSRSGSELRTRIQTDKRKYREEWLAHDGKDRVNPARFFDALRARLPDDGFVVVDDGNHTFLTAELFESRRPVGFTSPTDFNAMGFAVPAAIGTQLANPSKTVCAIVGDGAFLMTGLEILTATTQNLGIVFFVFYDGELGQISQFQKIPLNRKTCTVLGKIDFSGIALATGAAFLELKSDRDAASVVEQAFAEAAKGRPVVVDVRIDYSRKTRFTRGVVKANLSRFPLGEKARFIGRAMKRHLLG